MQAHLLVEGWRRGPLRRQPHRRPRQTTKACTDSKPSAVVDTGLLMHQVDDLLQGLQSLQHPRLPRQERWQVSTLLGCMHTQLSVPLDAARSAQPH